MSTILKADNIQKAYSTGKNSQNVLNGINAEIEQGDFTVIMGASGAGKSTLLYVLSGMDYADSGKIIFNGEEIENYSADKMSVFRRKHCGFVFQHHNLLDSMNLMDNVVSVGLLCTKSKKTAVEKAQRLFSQVNLSEDIQNKFPSQISGGEAQRAGIVRALINNPDIVFADEPTGSLDSSNGEMVLELLTEINNGGQSIIMVTHDFRSALRGNKIIYVKDGVCGGICDIGRYEENNAGRRDKLKTFLEERGW